MDCELLYKVYINLIDQKEPTLNFSVKNEDFNMKSKILEKDYFKKIVFASEEDIKKHKEYLKNNLKKNYF